MIQLYHGSGATDFTVLQDGSVNDEHSVLLDNAARLLTTRGHTIAAALLRTVPFQVLEATNHFNDEFVILHAVVPLEEYERLRNGLQDPDERRAYVQIADVLAELGTYTRFIAAELTMEQPISPATESGSGLKRSEVYKVVSAYIGVSGGYLGDFSYRTHHEFYIGLDLDIDPNTYEGTTRERFIKILSESAPDVQARILEGVLARFPVGSSELRAEERAAEFRRWIARLRPDRQVEQPTLRITSEVVQTALLDAEELLHSRGAASCVDRVHTALHGYLREVCTDEGLEIAEDASLTDLFKHLREAHPAFRDLGPRSDDVLRVFRALGTILDSLNPLRNRASVAHPNPSLLPEPEALLVVNVGRTILRYVDEKVHRQRSGEG